jgi:hypothetical protein
MDAAENPDLSILIAEDKPTKPFALLFGAPLPVKNRHMFAPTDNAEIVGVFRQISGQLAVCELVANRNLIHGEREGSGKILDEFSVFALVGIFYEVAPQGIGYGLYLLIGSFNNVHARLFVTSREWHYGRIQ